MSIRNVLFFLMIASSVLSIIDEEFRVVEMNMFDHENSYLPVRPGQKFIIEGKGNKTKGYSWVLSNSERLLSDGIVIPLNLDDSQSGDYYHHHDPEQREFTEGIFHFKFEASQEKMGMQKLEFLYKKNDSNEVQATKNININVVRPHSGL